MGRHKKPNGLFGPVHEALDSASKNISAAEEASTDGKKREKLNASIVAIEKLWQELRFLARDI
jgi:hypothetical protein